MLLAALQGAGNPSFYIKLYELANPIIYDYLGYQTQ